MAQKVTITFVSSVAGAIAGINKVHTATKRLSASTLRMGQNINSFGQSMFRNVTLPIAGALALATKEAIDFEKQLINASRALDFSEMQTKKFSKAARAIAPSLALTPAAFSELASEAGKLGVAARDIEGFAINTAKFAAATDTNATLLAQRLAAIKAVYGSSNKELLKFSATVNLLDDAIGGTTKGILAFTTRLAGVAKTTGFSAEQLAAIGATFQKLGFRASAAATGTNTLLVNLASATTLSKKAQGAFQNLGVSAEQVQQWMRTNPQEGLLRFLKIASEFKGDRLGTLTTIFGRNHAPKIIALAEAYTELNRAFELTTQTQRALNKLNAETDKRLNSSAGQIAIFRAQLSNLGITLGTALLPALNSILKAITPLIIKFAQWAENNPKLLQMGVAIAGITAVVAPLLIALGSVISAVSVIAPIITGIGAGIGVVATAILAFVGSPVALILAAVAAIAAGAYAIYANWDKLGKWFQGFSDAFVQNFQYLGGDVEDTLRDMTSKVAFFTQNPLLNLVNSFWQISHEGSKATRSLGNEWQKFTKDLSIVTNYISSAFSNLFLVSIPNAFQAGMRFMTETVWGGLHNFWTRDVPGFFQRVGNWFHEAGKSLMITFANGIRSQVYQALKPIIDFTNQVRSYLPSSDAKRGALSDLTYAGRALLDTVAAGVSDRRLLGAVQTGLTKPRNAIAFDGVLPAPTGSNITINFSPNIYVGGRGENTQNIVEQLQPYARELVELLERSQNRNNRGF